MSQTDSTQSFIEMFDSAFDRAHRRTDGAHAPSESVKDRVMDTIARASIRSETADPSVFSPGHVSSPSSVAEKRSTGMDMAIGEPFSANSRSRSQWWTAMMAAVAVVVVLATLHMMLPQSSPGGDHSNLAMAPAIATPEASACTVEPLTADEVMALVRYPGVGYDRWEAQAGNPGMYVQGSMEVRGPIMERSPILETLDDLSLFRTPDPEVDLYIADVKAAAEMFWTCLLFGTSFQVWGLMAPEFVQGEILAYYPLFRTEDDVMDTIQRVGALPYWANGMRTFHPSGSLTSESFLKETADGIEGIWVADTDGPFQDRVAIVELYPVNPEDALDPRPQRFLLQRYGDNQWIVLGVDWQFGMPG